MSRPATRVGLLGAGYIADWHARALRTVPGARVAAVCDQSAARAGELAARLGAEPFTDLGAMLAGAKLDAVHVLLPPAAHAAAAEQCLRAGVAVYLEKPMCLTAGECEHLESRDGALAVGHNFLFDPNYERLRADVEAGRLGRVEHATIVWAKEFGPARGGPFGMWALREPGNILLEVGPHPVAHLLDLLGDPDKLDAEAFDPMPLPTGGTFFRRWTVRSRHGRATAETRLHLGGGFPEHKVEVRGTAGTATADFERGTYVLRRRTHAGDDVDRYRRTLGEGRLLAAQGRRNLLRYALSKAKLVREGNAFGASIGAAVRAFYAGLPGVPDRRLTAAFGGRVVRLCRRVADAAEVPAPAAAPPSASGPADVLVLGGTGFIGRALVRKLAAEGRRVRLLARDPASVPLELRKAGHVEVVRGDLNSPADLARALEGAPAVVHLARSRAATREEYRRDEIGLTERIAGACLTAGVPRLVYTGTTDSYYSGGDETITEETPLDPKMHRRNLYAWAKAESEARLFALHRDRNLPVVVARPAVVVGPGGDPHHWGVGFWASPGACVYWGSGDRPVPLVLADDVADALVKCLDTPGIEGESFNLAAGGDVTPRDYVAALNEVSGGVDARPRSPLAFFAADAVKYAAKLLTRHPGRRLPSLRDWKSRTYRARYDCSKARRVLGWQPASGREELLERGARAPAREWFA